jgi:hypothetical protein
MLKTLKIFTGESIALLKGMDKDERLAKFLGVCNAFFKGQLEGPPMAQLAIAAGVDQELVAKVLAAYGVKGMTGVDDAANTMNLQPNVAGVFYPAAGNEFDFGFEELFELVDMRSSMQTQFNILGITNGITFREVKSGEKMKVYGISDTKSTVNKMIVAAAIGILDDWINYNQYWNLNQALVEARGKYYNKMSTDHYALIKTAGSANTQAFATDDITTINNACAAILAACAAKGFTLTGNEVFELRANISLKARIEKAFALTFNSPVTTAANQLVHTLNRKYTTQLVGTSYQVILPGRKLMRGIWSDLKAEADRDILLRGSEVAYSGEYNAAVGEGAQVKQLALS